MFSCGQPHPTGGRPAGIDIEVSMYGKRRRRLAAGLFAAAETPASSSKPMKAPMTLLLSLLLATSAVAMPRQSGPTPAASAQPAPPKASDPDETSDPAGELPVSVDRIKDALSRPPAIRLDDSRAVFRVEVIGRKITIEDILGPDYLKGPIPAVAGGMTHQEFLDLVTPKDVQGYAAFSNGEALTVAATSFALQWALQKAIHKFQEAKADRDREAARKEVQDALAELEKARIKAGLPPK